MAQYRCAVCGSPNIVTDTKNEGYDYLKGAVGTVVFGTVGAVAGINGKQKAVYKCCDCGMELTYTMPQELKNAIDLGLVSEEARSNLYIGNTKIFWRVLKDKYKNIEDGIVDEMLERRENAKKENLLAYATATKEEFDKAVDLIVDFERRLSCNSSIYDTLPEDVFSDEKPMTLVEYYAWQDAIALLIENMAKYLPYPLVAYRGLSAHHMLDYFVSYLYEQVRIYFGQIPEFTGYKHCEAFRICAELNPFVLYFLDKYFPRSFLPYGEIERKVIPWEPKDVADILREHHFLGGFIPTMVNIGFEFTGRDGKKETSYHQIPRYTVKDGRICFWRESNPHHRVADGVATMEDYFMVYPEKRSEFDSKVAVYKRQLSEKPNIEKQIKVLEQDIANNKSIVKTKEYEITQLRKKIFGRKSALARAFALEYEVQTIQKKTTTIETEIRNLKTKLKKTDLNQIVDEREFYRQLLQEMDYFIAWRWADDENMRPFWTKYGH